MSRGFNSIIERNQNSLTINFTKYLIIKTLEEKEEEMIGIVSYGGYIPKNRISRMTIFQANAWFAPATIQFAQGEKAFCNWDEDALSMAVEASRDCLKGMNKKDVDALFLASTTLPYADRQNAGIVATALNLKEEIITADFTGSLKAGTTALLSAIEAVRSGSRKNILVTASDKRETKCAYLYEMWFGDGAASLLIGSENLIAEFKGSYSVSYDFVDHYREVGKKTDYIWEERWIRDEGYMKIIPEAINGLLKKYNIGINDFSKIIYPCPFKRAHRDIGKLIGASKEKIQDNMHEVCGEMGAAHPFAMFISALEEANPGDNILMVSFGQGADALWFKVTDNIKNLPPRKGIKGSLADRREVTSYEKYCIFRDLLSVEMGIRAEAGGQSPLSILWRNRKMILGLVGGRCTKCGTPQYPKSHICVNPECRAFHSQEDYEFADREAKIISYTGDLLAISVEPPAIYGLIEFDGGGRMLVDFTDCQLEDLKVGQKVRMSFRKRWHDKERGFHGYYWKAVPQKGE